jgi:hypothetical protein
MGRKSTLSRLKPEVRAYIEARLAEGQMTLDELIEDVRARFPEDAQAGELPSRSAVGRYGQNLMRRLSAIKASTEAARMIRDQAGDSQDARSEALTALVQTELFEAILGLQEASDPDLDQGERVAMLSSAAKNIATLTRSSVNLKKFQAEAEDRARKELVAQQREKLDELGRTGAVPADVLAQVIKAAYDL